MRRVSRVQRGKGSEVAGSADDHSDSLATRLHPDAFVGARMSAMVARLAGLVSCSLLALSGCGGGEGVTPPPPNEPNAQVTGIVLSPDSAVLLGTSASTTLTATVATVGPPRVPATVSWTTTDSNVARIVPNGQSAVIQAVGPGRTVISARAGTFTDVAEIEVRALPPTFPAIRWNVASGYATAGAASASLAVLLGDRYSYTSVDGVDWQQHNAAIGIQARELLFNGSRFIAIGFQGVATSVDGVSWTTLPALASVPIVASQTIGTMTVLVTDGGATLRSSDGVSWSAGGNIGAQPAWLASNGRDLIGLTLRNQMTMSADSGRTWNTLSPVLLPNESPRGRPVWDGRQYVSIGNGERATSPDGARWTIQPITLTWNQPGGTPVSSLFAEDLLWTGSRFYATVNFSVSPERGAILESTDAITWREVSVGPIGLMRPLFTAPNGTVIAAGDGAVQSTTAGRWTMRLLPERIAGTARLKRSVDRFMLIAANQRGVFVSRDDRSWEALEIPNLQGQGIANVGIWTGSQYVIGTSFGTLLTSPDGVTWTSRSTAVRGQVLDLISEAGRVLALTQGGILTSSDGVTFTLTTAAQDGNALGWTGTHFVLVARGRAAKRSADGVTWQDVTLPVEISDGGLVRLGGFLTHVSTSVLQTVDGLTWTNRGPIDNATASPGSHMAAVGTLALGCAGATSTPTVSSDGRSWFPLPLGSAPLGCEALAGGGGRVILSNDAAIHVGIP